MNASPTSLRYHLRELERHYADDSESARRVRLRIAQAAARGARKGRRKTRRNAILAGTVAALVALACIFAGGCLKSEAQVGSEPFQRLALAR